MGKRYEEQVLDHFRDRFVAEVDAPAIVFELEHQGIISNGDRRMISLNLDRTQQNQCLHACLKKTCTMKTLMDVCDIVIAVQGNPRMNLLGEDLKWELFQEKGLLDKLSQSRSSVAPHQPHSSAAPRQSLSSAAPRQPLSSVAPRQPLSSAAPHQSLSSAAPRQSLSSAAPRQPLSSAASRQSQSLTGSIQPDVLSSTVYTYEGCFILFRKYVSRKAPGKGRALLEGIGLAPETIKACYSSNPLDEEAAVQDGLHKWAEGHHGCHPTWRVLLDAMEYAGIGRQHCEGLREELDQKLIEVPAQTSQPQSLAFEPSTPPPPVPAGPSSHRHRPHAMCATAVPQDHPPDLGSAHTDMPASSSFYTIQWKLILIVGIVSTICVLLIYIRII